MPDTFWKKILRDLRGNAFRVFLALASVMAATFALSTVSSSFWVLRREMNANFLETNPASATLWVEPRPGQNIVQALEKSPLVATAELRKIVEGRLKVAPDVWQTLLLYVVHDFDSLRVNRFFQIQGEKSVATGEISIERSCVDVTRAAMNDSLLVQVEGGQAVKLHWTGIVHDPAQAPGWMHGEIYGFISPATLEDRKSVV